MDVVTAGIVPARLDDILARFGFHPKGPEAVLLVVSRTATILWASQAALERLATDDVAMLEQALFRESPSGRAYASRLARLRADAAFRLDRLVMPGRATPVVAACHPVADEAQPMALLHLRGLVALPLAAADRPMPAPATPPETAPSAEAPVLPVTRIAWESDAAGRVTRVGPEVRILGSRSFGIGDDLPGLLHPFAPAIAERLAAAAAQSGSAGLVRVDWPAAGDAAALLVEIGYAARRGAASGLRGILAVHGAADVGGEAASTEQPEPVQEADAETIGADAPADEAPVADIDSEAIAPSPENEQDTAEKGPAQEVPAEADPEQDGPEVDAPEVPAEEPVAEAPAPVVPEERVAEPARGNVVHFPVMRIGPVPANFGAPLRPPLLPDAAPLDAADLQAPQWAEAPAHAAFRDAPEPEGLSADERDAFEHIRKVLGTRPFAAKPLATSPESLLPAGVAPLLDRLPIPLRLALRGSTFANQAWRNRADDEAAGETVSLDFAGERATLTLLPSSPAPGVLQSPEAVAPPGETLDLVTDGHMRIDEGGIVRTASPKAARLLGMDPGAILGRPFTALLFEGQGPSWQALAAAATGPEAQPQGPSALRLRNAAGQPMAVLVRLARSEGGLLCALTVDRPAASPANDTAEAARREAERTSALKSEFLAKVSHEIRTPLNAILGFAEVIRDERLGPVGNARYLEYLRDIHASGTHVMSLVNDLLDLSRIEAGRMDLNLEAVDANAVVQSCVNTLQTHAHRDRVIVRQSLTPRLPPTLADERSLRQIVLNLLSNAIKFNEPGGQVIVSTALAGSHAIAIRIRDTGIGMSEDEIEAAMEPFRQISTVNRTGSGLGLPLTKALVEANCASMTIKSTRGEGTLVEVTFPLVEQDSVSLPAE